MDSRAVRTFRAFVVGTAGVAIGVGVLAIVLPRPSLVLVAVLFSIYLVVAGALRVLAAFRGHGAPRAWRWSSGSAGVVVAAAGLLGLLDPVEPLLLLAVLLGIGFLLEGAVAAVAVSVGHPGSSRAPTVVSGLLSVIAGVAVLLAPGLALTVFMVITGMALVLVGLGTLLQLPARAAARR